MSHREDASAYHALRARYAASLVSKHRQLARAWAMLQGGGGRPEAREQLIAQLHRLCGSASAYGYPAIGRSACEAERCLVALGTADRALERAVNALLAEIEAVIAAQAAASGDACNIILLMGASTSADWLTPTLRARGCHVQRVADTAMLWPLLAGSVCHAVVLDASVAPPLISAVVRGVRETPSPLVPLLIGYCTEGAAGAAEVALAAGCDAVMTEGDGAERLLELVGAAHGRGGPAQGAAPT
ncbi:hypothetical protein [Dokdonella sp.]|uniref:hypothetical protein n=1 Tax=Dokdonella sp. TaxID=2291710 RepID=UPI0031CA5CAC|nr:Hpt domain-containing protein [Dokdonella sp.]